MSDFFSLKVKKINKLTDQAVEIVMDAGENRSNFNFKSGQYLTVRFNLNGEEERRSYSLCSDPADDLLSIGVKEMNPGTVSVFLNNDLTEGDVIECTAPEGNFVAHENPGSNVHHVLFAAGSGITPIISIIRTLLKKDPENKITLFYGNTSVSSTMFLSELEQLNRDFGQFELVNILTDGSTASPLTTGRIDFSKTWDLLDNFIPVSSQKLFYLCGPGGMIESTKSALSDRGVEDKNIHTEYFSAPEKDSPVTESSKVAAEENFEGKAEVTVVLDYEEHHFELDGGGEAILDATLDRGIDAPYSCKGGVCTTCKAKLIEGSVKMDANYALTDGEISDGYILTCQSHPSSQKVKLTWDE